jgi:hypothetical protein
MNLLQDVVGGWRARPLLFAAKVLLGFTLSLLICGGRWMLHKADAESQRLLQTWPADQCTLLLPDDPAADLFRDLQARLPPDSWLATRIEGNSVWILGSLPADFFQGRGHSLSPDLIQRGEAVALLAEGVDRRSGLAPACAQPAGSAGGPSHRPPPRLPTATPYSGLAHLARS